LACFSEFGCAGLVAPLSTLGAAVREIQIDSIEFRGID